MKLQEEAPEKSERLALAEVRTSVHNKLQDAMSRFIKLGDRIDLLKVAQDKIKNKEILPLFEDLDTLKLEEKEEGGGWYIAERPGRKNFDREKFTRLLVSRGVDPTLIKRCMKAAEKTGKGFVEVVRGKGRKKNGEEEE